MAEPEEDQRDTQQTEAPQDGPEAGGSSQGAPSVGGGSDGVDERPVPAPSAPSDTNEKADSKASVVEPDGGTPPAHEEEG